MYGCERMSERFTLREQKLTSSSSSIHTQRNYRARSTVKTQRSTKNVLVELYPRLCFEITACDNSRVGSKMYTSFRLLVVDEPSLAHSVRTEADGRTRRMNDTPRGRSSRTSRTNVGSIYADDGFHSVFNIEEE